MQQQSHYIHGLSPDKRVLNRYGNRTAENSCQYMLPALHQKVKEKPNLKLLDVGCGPGSITLGLARYVPEGTITGVDLSSSSLENAEKLAQQQGIANVTFQTANIHKLPFDDETFDVVHTHQTVCHCTEAVNAIKELIRVTRRGGIVCMKEADMYSARFFPESPLLVEVFKGVGDMMTKSSGWGDAGVRLKAWTVEAGIPRSQIVHTASAWCYDTLEARKGFDGGRMLRGGEDNKMVELGILKRERLPDYESAWKEWEENEDGVMFLMHGEIVATV